MTKTIQEINEKIKQGQAVVVTAAEIIEIAKQEGVKKAAERVDVVTTGTFGPMCSSGAYFNIGHAKPRIKLGGGRSYRWPCMWGQRGTRQRRNARRDEGSWQQ